MYKRKRRQPKITTKEKSYRFWNCGAEYICKIVAPVIIPDYKLKEVFDNTFVGKRDMSVITVPLAFKSLHDDISYTVVPVKEVN